MYEQSSGVWTHFKNQLKQMDPQQLLHMLEIVAGADHERTGDYLCYMRNSEPEPSKKNHHRRHRHRTVPEKKNAGPQAA